MSVMDQAFIRAYHPGMAARSVPGSEAEAGPERVETAEASAATGLDGDGHPGSQSAAGGTREPPAEPAPEAAGQPTLKAAFRVDRLAWAGECTKLAAKAPHQLDSLADGLRAACARGHKVIAATACRRGEGCTTVLLAAARRLAQQGRRVVVVDADLDDPQLARRLGLLPETGWDEVLAGRQPLGEAMIESDEDRLTVVPLLGPLSGEVRSGLTYSALAASLGALRGHYELVLVDLGPFDAAAASESAGHWIDGAVLVQDIRTTSQAEIAVARKRVEAAGVVEIGVVENFV